MYERVGPPPCKRYNIQSLAVRTGFIFIAAALLSAVLYSLIRSEGINEAGPAKRHYTRKAVIDVTILPDLDERLLIDVADLRLDPTWTSERHPQEIPDKGSTAAEITDGAQDSTKVPHPKQSNIYESDTFKKELRVAQQQPPGVVSRLKSSVENPLGSAELTENPLCAPFIPRTQHVGIIGNGPLKAQDRKEIDKLDVVVRFNLMNNWQRFQEKIDVWIMRYSSEATASYWGINNINKTEADKIIQSLEGVWLVGGNQSHADKLTRKYPDLLTHHTVLMPEAAMNKAFAAGILDSPASYPSTGFVGIQAALHCTPATVKLHIYGFNWSSKTWSGHNVQAERAFVLALSKQGRAVIHETACEGMRECGEGDVDASCHWSTDGRYMCLRGKPKKWKDMTDKVTKSRQEEFRANPA